MLICEKSRQVTRYWGGRCNRYMNRDNADRRWSTDTLGESAATVFEWLSNPINAGAAQAFAAICQLLLAVVLAIATGYSVRLSRENLAEYRRELLDQTLPVLVFQLWPNPPNLEEEDDGMTEATDLRVLNAGRGVTLDIACGWEAESTVKLLPAAPPIALAPGESFHVTFAWSVFLSMFHTPQSKKSERKTGENRSQVKLGTVRCSYLDIHSRPAISEVDLEFLYIGQTDPQPDDEGWIRVSREFEFGATSLANLRFTRPPDMNQSVWRKVANWGARLSTHDSPYLVEDA